PLPDTAVTASIWLSCSSHRLMPTALRMLSASFLCSALTRGTANRPLTPGPRSAGVLGMQRISGVSAPSQAARLSQVMPAAMEITSWPERRGAGSAAHTACMTCGLTDSTSTSQSRASSALSVVVWMPNWRCSRSSCSALVSLASIWPALKLFCSMPPMRLVAMLPAPMNPIRGVVISLFLCCGSGVVAGAEQRSADTHQGRALGDGLVQIVAHAHGQGVQRQLEGSHGLAQGAQWYAAGGAVAGRCGDGHQATQTQAGQGGHGAGQFRQLGQGYPGLAGLAADVHLQADIQRCQLVRPLGRQSLGDFQAIDAVHPVEMLGDGPGLVRLDRPDEVPDQRQILQFGHLGQGFLQVILPDVLDAGSDRFADVRRCPGLADRHQGDLRGITTGSVRSTQNAHTNVCNILCYRGHYGR